jgi:hypothetical protein
MVYITDLVSTIFNRDLNHLKEGKPQFREEWNHHVNIIVKRY